MYRPVLVTAPTSTPITLTEAKAHLRVEDPDNDSLITALIAAAVTYLDGWTGILGRCLFTQTWRQDYDELCLSLQLPLVPVASIGSVTYLDAAGASQTVASANYTLLNDELGPYVRFNDAYSFPAVRSQGPAVSVSYVAGSAAADVPQAIKQAMLLLIAHWYENRESVVIGAAVSSLPMAVDALLAPHRRVKF